MGDRSLQPLGQCFQYRQRLYASVAVRLDDYAVWLRPVSNRWDTVAMPATVFRRMTHDPADDWYRQGPGDEPRELTYVDQAVRYTFYLDKRR